MIWLLEVDNDVFTIFLCVKVRKILNNFLDLEIFAN